MSRYLGPEVLASIIGSCSEANGEGNVVCLKQLSAPMFVQTGSIAWAESQLSRDVIAKGLSHVLQIRCYLCKYICELEKGKLRVLSLPLPCDEFSPNITLAELASPAMAERISAV